MNKQTFVFYYPCRDCANAYRCEYCDNDYYVDVTDTTDESDYSWLCTVELIWSGRIPN